MAAIRSALALATVSSTTVLSALAGAASAHAPQAVHLDVSTGDGHTTARADLQVTRDGDRYRLRGSVVTGYGSSGCVKLRAVEMHMGSAWGGTDIIRACGSDRTLRVDAATRHHQIELLVDEAWAPDWESRIVTLTG